MDSGCGDYTTRPGPLPYFTPVKESKRCISKKLASGIRVDSLTLPFPVANYKQASFLEAIDEFARGKTDGGARVGVVVRADIAGRHDAAIARLQKRGDLERIRRSYGGM